MSSHRTPTAAERALVLGEGHLEAAQYMEAEHRFAEAHAQLRLAIEQFVEAGDHDHEREAWQRAALLSKRQAALDRASDEIQRAVVLARVPGLEKELAVALGHRGVIYALRGLPVDAAVAWHEAIDLAEQLKALGMVSALATNLGQIELGRNNLEQAERAFLRALAAAEAEGNDAERGAAENALGEIARARGDLGQAQLRFDSALTAIQRTPDIGALALTFANLGNIARVGGNLGRAERLFEASFKLAVAIGDAAAVARAHANLGNIAAARGHIAEARRHYDKGLVLDRKHGQVQAEIGGLVNLANLLVVEGRLGEARDRFNEALDKLRPLRALRTMADVLLLLGQVEARLGHLSAAEASFTHALDAARTAGYRPGEARLRLCLAAVDHAKGHVKKALAAYREAVHGLEAEGVASDVLTAHLVVAECALVAGDRELAEAALATVESLLAARAAESGESEEAEGPREALDAKAMRVRLELSRPVPSDDARRHALEVAAELEAAERVVDALGLKLAVADEGASPDHDRMLAQSVAEAARELELEPLRLDAQSLVWALAPDDATLFAFEEIAARAATMGLGLLAARIRRRLVATLKALGQSEKAEALRQSALAWARVEGADEEVARLERLGAR